MRGEQSTLTTLRLGRWGSSPRARGAGRVAGVDPFEPGIIPACAGSSGFSSSSALAAADHPRVRGEQFRATSSITAPVGSSPRARGAVRGVGEAGHPGWIIPACAGSSRSPPKSPWPTRDHPRVRGEQVAGRADEADVQGIIPACAGSRGHVVSGRPGPGGSSPRARGADATASIDDRRERIIPACAGSRPRPRSSRRSGSDHPRVRGEQMSVRSKGGRGLGSSPRARGAVVNSANARSCSRIIPACAGSSWAPLKFDDWIMDHPRVRGEQTRPPAWPNARAGSSPRARGAEPRLPARLQPVRIIPACAGSSHPVWCSRRWPWDHPRVRGEQGCCCGSTGSTTGSSPRARGAGQVGVDHGWLLGIIPACAGSSRPRPTAMPYLTDHPRVRGEQAASAGCAAEAAGSSPRARGAGSDS